MDTGYELICRMCLCKCENPRNMLVDKEFATKVMNVFPKVEVRIFEKFTNFFNKH